MFSNRKSVSPMGWFTLRYTFWGPFLFGLLYFENFSPLIIFNEWQTALSVVITHHCITLFDIPVTMIGPKLFFDHGLRLTIVHECNAMAAFLLFLAAVLSYPAPKKMKVCWIFIGYGVLLLANTVRLVGITYHVVDSPENFVFLHEVVGRYAIAVIPLILFYFFSNRAPLRKPVGFFRDSE